MSEPTTTTTTTPWVYFLSGCLLPAIAQYFLWRNQKQKAGDDDSDYEYEEESDDDDAIVNPTTNPKDWGMKDAPYKMVLVVNQELGMGKGKIAAQCGHASVGCYKKASKVCPSGLRAWEYTGCAKIALKCPTESEMQEIYTRAKQKGLPLYLVEDAGRTQIAAGSRTVLGILGPTYVFEDLTGHLKLL